MRVTVRKENRVVNMPRRNNKILKDNEIVITILSVI